jgi:hypothetical protein
MLRAASLSKTVTPARRFEKSSTSGIQSESCSAVQHALPSTRRFLYVRLVQLEDRTGGTEMPLQNHLTELERKHRALERELQSAVHHPSMDDTRLAELKRKKLHLKDEISRLRNGHSAVH